MLSAAWLIARKDLSIEFRTRTAFLSAVVFALLGLVIFYFAWDPTAVSTNDLAPGVLWVIFTFSGLLGLHRSFGVELADHAIDGILASPVSRESVFLGKAIANLATEELSHPAPVFHGDTLFCETEVLEVKESKSKPDRGTVRVHTRVLNQDGVLVAEFKRLVLVPRKTPGEPMESAESNVE